MIDDAKFWLLLRYCDNYVCWELHWHCMCSVLALSVLFVVSLLGISFWVFHILLYSIKYSGANSCNLAYDIGTSIAYLTCCGEPATQHCCGRLIRISCFCLIIFNDFILYWIHNNLFLYMLEQFDFVHGSGAVLEYLSFKHPFFSPTSLPSLNCSLGFVVCPTRVSLCRK